MNRIDEWSHNISQCLKSETELLSLQARHDLYEDDAKTAFIRIVLEKFLPSSFAIGSGRVIDSSGNSSNVLDIVIYRRDFPQLNLPGSTTVFLVESVLAIIEVKTKVVQKTFFDALDNCASMAKLDPTVNPVVLRKLAIQNKMSLYLHHKYVHKNPKNTARFDLIGRPASFVYAFSGYQTSLKQLKKNIDLWIKHRRKNGLNYEMKSFPTVIATQECFSWRNSAPFSMKNNAMLGLGKDSAPIRLIILQLMKALNKGLHGPTSSSGLNFNLDAYISDIAPPAFTSTCGIITNPVTPTTKRRPTIKKEIAMPAVKDNYSAPAKKLATRKPENKKAISKTAAKKVKLDSRSLETNRALKQAQATGSTEMPASAVKTNSSSTTEKNPSQNSQDNPQSRVVTEPVFKSMSDEELNNIEPELANPEFIEPEIVDPENDFSEEAEVKTDSESAHLTATIQMPSVETEKKSNSELTAKDELKSALEDKHDPEEDPFLQTIKVPTWELEKNSTR